MKLKITILALLLCGSAMAQTPIKVNTKDKTIEIEDATRITFSDDLSEQIIHSASGEEHRQALNNVWQVMLADTLHNLTDFLAEDAECLVHYWAMFNGAAGEQDYMGTHFYANFQTDGHQFAMFVPVDGVAFPRTLSLKIRTQDAITLNYKDRSFPIQAVAYGYNKATGVVGKKMTTFSATENEIANGLKSLLLRHTVLFERPEDQAAGLNSGNEYFQTLEGTFIRVQNGKVQGGYQMENEAAGLVNFTHSQIVETKQKKNGTFYKLDTPLLAPSKNAYEVLSGVEGEENPYQEFFNLCQVDDEIIRSAYRLDTLVSSQQAAILGSYHIFANTLSTNKYSVGNTIAPFPSHDFTLYVPTNEAVRRAIDEGLPTWESLRALCEGATDENGLLSEDMRATVQQQIEELVNFVKYHFHFGSEVADKLPFSARRHNTPIVLRENLATPKLTVSSKGNGTLSVTDALGHVRNVVDTHKNIFVRDLWTSKQINADTRILSGVTIIASSPGVIHLIDGVLRYK